MPEVDEKVMAFVETVLQEEPEIQLEDLFERTKNFDEAMGKLSRRQFNARYPLQVKRRRALAAKGGTPRKRKTAVRSSRRRQTASAPSTPRDAVRQVLLQFATDIAAAEERKDLVKVLAEVDHYVDQVFKGVGKD